MGCSRFLLCGALEDRRHTLEETWDSLEGMLLDPYSASSTKSSTPDEKQWVEQEPMFQNVDPVVKKHIRSDLVAGRWMPLREGPRDRGS